MHGLPGQTVAEGQRDIELALDAGVSHLSYYQLTIEPNTAFYRRPPTLPAESILERLEDRGQRLLEAGGFKPYEISAWAQDDGITRAQPDLLALWGLPRPGTRGPWQAKPSGRRGPA